jgi:hypothetical protein
MKKIPYILILLFIVCSCSDFLEEDISTLITAESGALSTEVGLTSALVGGLRPLSQCWNQGFGDAGSKAIQMGADDMTTHKASNKANFREFDQFVVSNNNDRLPVVWKGCYKMIQSMSNIIANYQKATGNQTTINQVGGEAYFFRAYGYFWIVRLWGKAPLVLTSQDYKEDILKISNSTEIQIYDQIISDLKMAETLLQDKKPQPGRVGKGTAKAVLAEVYLQMSGWPINDASKYALAAAKAKEVLDNEATYGFGLMSDFAALWPSPTVNNDGNKEEVFALNVWAGSWNNANAVYGLAARPGEEGGWDDLFPELTFYNEFPSGYRKNVTFYTQLANGTPWQQFSVKRPYYKKFMGPAKSSQNAISIPLERLAETYLIFAEAQIMATGNASDPLALEAFNKIKRRGAGLPLNTSAPGVDATSLTQKAIITEKGWEFAGEYCRWFDLVRLQLVAEVAAKKDPDELPVLGTIKYYIPIPASETLANPNLN